jgi:hypothetical protein
MPVKARHPPLTRQDVCEQLVIRVVGGLEFPR